jgi:hypothetical protein
MGLDTKTYWLTDRQLQGDCDLKNSSVGTELPFREDSRMEPEDQSLLEAVTREGLVKTLNIC